MYLGSLQEAAALAAGVSLVSILQAGDWTEFLHQIHTIFPPTSLLLISTRIMYSVLCWASVSWAVR